MASGEVSPRCGRIGDKFAIIDPRPNAVESGSHAKASRSGTFGDGISKKKKSMDKLKDKFMRTKQPAKPQASTSMPFLNWLKMQRNAVYVTQVHDHKFGFLSAAEGGQIAVHEKPEGLSKTTVTTLQRERLSRLGIEITALGLDNSANVKESEPVLRSAGAVIDEFFPFARENDLSVTTKTPLLSLDPFQSKVVLEPSKAREDHFNTMFGRVGLDITNVVLWHWSRAIHAQRAAEARNPTSDSSTLLGDGDYLFVESTGTSVTDRPELSKVACPDFVIWRKNDANQERNRIIAVGESKPSGTLSHLESFAAQGKLPFGYTLWPFDQSNAGWKGKGSTSECSIQVCGQMLLANVGRAFVLFDHGRGLLPLEITNDAANNTTADELLSADHAKLPFSVRVANEGWHTQHSNSVPPLQSSQPSSSIRWKGLPSIPVVLAEFALDALVRYARGNVPFPAIQQDDITGFCPDLGDASRASSMRKRTRQSQASGSASVSSWSVEQGRCATPTRAQGQWEIPPLDINSSGLFQDIPIGQTVSLWSRESLGVPGEVAPPSTPRRNGSTPSELDVVLADFDREVSLSLGLSSLTLDLDESDEGRLPSSW